MHLLIYIVTVLCPRLAPFVNRRFVAIFVVGRTLLREFEWKNETCDILVLNELKNAEHLTVRLQCVVLCTISAFWTVADVYSTDNVSQIMNLKAINKYTKHRYFALIYAII